LASTFTYVVDASAINIDDFTSNQSVSSHGGSPVNVNVSAPVVAIGGTRTFKTDLTQGTLDISLETNFGVLSHSQSAQVKGISTVTWDGDIDPGTLNSTGLPAINFFQDGGDAIVLDVLSADLPTEISVIAYDASDLTGGTFSKAKKALVPFSGLVNFSYLPALNDFTIVGPNGPADFTKIGALQIIIDGTVSQELDLSLESIKTNGICDLIPDPQGKVIDECGVCGGNNATCLGCDGIPNSGLMIDQCGVCGGDDTSCIGCDGELSSGLVLDECGVCGGDGTVCLDCAGEIFGTSIEDQCGVCGGDDLSCVSCNEVNIFETQAAMDALAKAQEFVTRAALKLLFSTGKATNKNFSKFISKTKGKVHELQINNWTPN